MMPRIAARLRTRVMPSMSASTPPTTPMMKSRLKIGIVKVITLIPFASRRPTRHGLHPSGALRDVKKTSSQPSDATQEQKTLPSGVADRAIESAGQRRARCDRVAGVTAGHRAIAGQHEIVGRLT